MEHDPVLDEHERHLVIPPLVDPPPPAPLAMTAATVLADMGSKLHAANLNAAMRMLIRHAGGDPNAPGLADTPRRYLDALAELTAAPGDPAELLAVTFTEHADQMITVGPVEFVSLCEHHMLPFVGTAWVGYIPSGNRVCGLSKLARLVEHHARRLTMQERIVSGVVADLRKHLSPLGAGCVATAAHSCMGLRGVAKPGARMTTSALDGVLREDDAARAEFLALARG